MLSSVLLEIFPSRIKYYEHKVCSFFVILRTLANIPGDKNGLFLYYVSPLNTAQLYDYILLFPNTYWSYCDCLSGL